MAEEENNDLEHEFNERNETLRGFYNADMETLTDEERASLTPILNSLKERSYRYREVEHIAEGGEKVITLVHDLRLDRQVAMAHAKENRDFEQFLREARLTANLGHPNIMPVHNMGLDLEDRPFFSMELVPGDSLKTIIRKLRDGDAGYKKKYPRTVLLNIFIKICDAIAYAHSRSVLHLDIKPDNIRVGEFGEVLVCDWGLACVMNASESSYKVKQDEDLDADLLNDMTLSGTMKGTPGFMAPEQTLSESEKLPQTDVYSLGAVLYMLLTFRLPVRGKSANEVVKNTREGNITPPKRMPHSLVAITMKALALNPENRYETVMALAHDVRLHLSGRPTEAEHASWFTHVTLLLQRHSSVSLLIIFFLAILAGIIGINSLAVSKEKAEAIAAREQAEENFSLYLKEQQHAKELGENFGEAVQYTVRSRDFVNAPSMIKLLETGLNAEVDPDKQKNLLEQKGILHFVLQQFNAANECFDAAGKTERIERLSKLSLKYAKLKNNDQSRLTDDQLAKLFTDRPRPDRMTLYYLYYHHMQRRPASATPEEYISLAGAVLDKLNYSRSARRKPLSLAKTDQGYHLDLSNYGYSTYEINIVGVYERNVLAPFNLNSLDISHNHLRSIRDLHGMTLDTLNMTGVQVGRKHNLPHHIKPLRLKKLILNASDYRAETIEKLREHMEVIDADQADLKANQQQK